MKKSLNDKKEYIFDRLKFICHFNLTQLLYIVELLLRLPSRFLASGVAVVGRRVEVGWEGVRSDASERYGKNLRLKLMPFLPSFLHHRFVYPLSSCFSIRMKVWIVVRDVCVHCHSIAQRAQTG
jgi:hypothetical protein